MQRELFFCGNRNVSKDWGRESRSQYGCADRMALGDGQVSVWMGQSGWGRGGHDAVSSLRREQEQPGLGLGQDWKPAIQ